MTRLSGSHAPTLGTGMSIEPLTGQPLLQGVCCMPLTGHCRLVIRDLSMRKKARPTTTGQHTHGEGLPQLSRCGPGELIGTYIEGGRSCNVAQNIRGFYFIICLYFNLVCACFGYSVGSPPINSLFAYIQSQSGLRRATKIFNQSFVRGFGHGNHKVKCI